MKKRLILLIVISISISLVGLIGIQLYWIRNAIAVKEVHFERGVSEAVNRTIQKYNKIELARRVLVQREKNQQMNHFMQLLDSLNQVYYKQFVSGQTRGPAAGEPTAPSPRQEIQIQYGLIDGEGRFELADSGFFDIPFGNPAGPRSGYLPGPDLGLGDDPVSMFFERSRIINDLFDDLFSNRFSYHHGGDEGFHTLDSLLALELQHQGINTLYEFGVFNPVFNTMLDEKTGKYTRELLQSPHVYSLFPSDVFMNPDYLLLYFPEQQQFILAQMNVMMGLSTLLILVIISSFAMSILIMIRQKKLSVMKNDFINNMTHELKTPISTISLACQALSDQDMHKSEDLYQRYIGMIDEENQRLGAMTEKVLQTALIDKGKLRLHFSGTDMHLLIQEAIHQISLQVEAKNGRITTQLNAEYSFLHVDKIHMAGVLFNLLDNANKYSPINPRITVSTENSSQGLIIHVQDQGVGISRSAQKKIFDTLYRVSTGNIHDVKGFGLGLSYVKAIVEKHGGWVKVSSEPRKGSRFTLFVPFGLENKKKQAGPDMSIQ